MYLLLLKCVWCANWTYEWQPPFVAGMIKTKHLHIRGLMNTGTNFLSAILKSTSVTAREEEKHMIPWLVKRKDLDVIMVRHPMSWITGMRKAPYFLDGTCLRLSAGRFCFSSLVDIWNRYYSAYLEWDNAVLVRYEDLLLDATTSVAEILKLIGAKKKIKIVEKPAKTHGKSRSLAGAQHFNLMNKWRDAFSLDELKGHCSQVNTSLMDFFHYACPPVS